MEKNCIFVFPDEKAGMATDKLRDLILEEMKDCVNIFVNKLADIHEEYRNKKSKMGIKVDFQDYLLDEHISDFDYDERKYGYWEYKERIFGKYRVDFDINALYQLYGYNFLESHRFTQKEMLYIIANDNIEYAIWFKPDGLERKAQPAIVRLDGKDDIAYFINRFANRYPSAFCLTGIIDTIDSIEEKVLKKSQTNFLNYSSYL